MTEQAKQIQKLVTVVQGLHKKIDDLEVKIRARGTQDIRKKSPLFVGDEGPTSELKAVVKQAISVRGMTLQELSDVTGARRNRISGVLVKLQLDGEKVVNEGDGYRAIWRIK